MKTVNIKGKEYVEVNERIKYFREKYKNWSLTSKIISLKEGVCVIRAVIRDENGVVKATGLAYEKESSSFINKTSYIENCETSAWGRALGNLGIGIDASIASADEVQNAQRNQEDAPKVNNSKAKPTVKQLAYLKKLLVKVGKSEEEIGEIVEKCKTSAQASVWINKAEELSKENEPDPDDAYHDAQMEKEEAFDNWVNQEHENQLDNAW